MDPKIPFLPNTLNLSQAQAQLRAAIPGLRQVMAATLVRHKPGRRALIEYQLDIADGPIVVLGKIRAKGTDWNSYHLQKDLWCQGFAANSPDGLCVPEPLGVIPDWRMWLQRKVPGVPATDLLPTPAGISLAHRIAALAYKLHHTPVSPQRTHILADEVQILRDRLLQVAQHHPQWQPRIQTILASLSTFSLSPSERLRQRLRSGQAPPPPRSLSLIHRDFYPDQILVDHNRLWLVDLDLGCMGDPALDIGNFIAHITEQSLRQMGNPAAMGDREVALREAFIDAWGREDSDQTSAPRSAQELRRAIDLYTLLTLIRHIQISTRIPARRSYTEAILTLCETRLQPGFEY